MSGEDRIHQSWNLLTLSHIAYPAVCFDVELGKVVDCAVELVPLPCRQSEYRPHFSKRLGHLEPEPTRTTSDDCDSPTQVK